MMDSFNRNDGDGRYGTSHQGDPHRGGRGRARLDATPWWLVLALTAGCAAMAFFAMEIWLRQGYMPIMVSVLSFLAPALCGVFILWRGWLVRSYQAGKRALSSLAAARTFLLAQAGSRAGAVLLGGALGVAGAYWRVGPNDWLSAQLLHLGIASVASIFLIVSALIAERWCMVKDGEGEDPPAPKGAGAPA